MSIRKETYPVTGMSCAACASRVNKTLGDTQGVICANVNLATAMALIEYDDELTNVDRLRIAVENAGYGMITESSETAAEKARIEQDKRLGSLKRNVFGAAATAVVVMCLNMFLREYKPAQYAQFLLTIFSLAFFGREFYANALRQARHGGTNMDTLVAVSTFIAFLFSSFNLFAGDFWASIGIEAHLYFESAAMISAFILAGRLMEAKAKHSTTSAIRKLIALRPETVTVVTSEGEIVKNIKDIAKGDIIIAKPGERIAFDGKVVRGRSSADESLLTGESMPVSKDEGDGVYAGTINLDGAIEYAVAKVGSGTILGGIIRMVQDAQGSRAPVQKLVDKVAGVFVPVIMALSVASLFIWLMADPSADGLTHGLLAMVTVLIIACPCALGLATPTAIMVGIGKGAENGILIKDAEAIERAKEIDTIVVDKTGTITEGVPNVDKFEWIDINESERSKLSAVLYKMESGSTHPLANSICRYLGNAAEGHNIELQGLRSIAGCGIIAQTDGKTYYAGNSSILPESVSADGSFTFFADDSRLIARISFSDKVKQTSFDAIKELKHKGIEIVMMTGDNELNAKSVAELTGITQWKSGAKPEDKLLYIKNRQEEGHKVAMVGDGINDSAALAQADLSIAMGRGADIAIDAAQVTILSSDIRKIYQVINLSELTTRTIKQNLFWAFLYNSIAVPVAAGALYPVCGFLLNPMIGGAAMAMSSVSVVCNSLRLKRKDLSKRNNSTKNNNIRTNKKTTTMEKTYNVKGMMCQHCRAHVEDALNSIEGVKATVTLETATAKVEFCGKEKSLDELQKVVSEKAGKDFILSE